jgi:hypothetical protein
MSLDRLIDLAQRTGDRLIVHNPVEQQDVVIMSVDEYENLIDSRRSVHGLSSDQLLDQINRDISAWRTDKEESEQWEKTMQLEDELWNEEMRDYPFTEEPWRDDWHRAGDILEDRYDFNDGEDEEDFEEDKKNWQPPRFDWDGKIMDDELKDIGFPFNDGFENRSEVKVEDIPFDPRTAESYGGAWEEEPLPSDEPVFYEEPV